MKLYNTLTKKKEDFKPIQHAHVNMYNCGPTVYNYVHIGNLRSFLFADILRRYFETFKEWTVTQVMNITDVGHMTDDADEGEDKMEVALKKLDPALRRQIKTPFDLAHYYEDAFFEDMEKLSIRRAHQHPRATEFIKPMIRLVEKLIDKGFAYEVKGNVYFSVEKFPGYGKLSGNTVDKLKAGARVEVNPDKKHPADFALWRIDPHHIMKWPSPWGEGFPGWHLECSIMSTQFLGDTFDIHTGGEDNIFPHHECEIAQAEAATGKPFVRFWMHVRHLKVDGKKMSKSLDNFYTLRDLVEKGYDPDAVRYTLLGGHYRQNLNFTLKGIDASKKAIQRLRDFRMRMLTADSKEPDSGLSEAVNLAEDYFEAALDDDLNVSAALGVLFDFVSAVNKMEVSRKKALEVLEFLGKVDAILGVIETDEVEADLSAEERKLLDERMEARKNKDFQKSDEIRDKLAGMGVIVKDTPKGQTWKRK